MRHRTAAVAAGLGLLAGGAALAAPALAAPNPGVADTTTDAPPDTTPDDEATTSTADTAETDDSPDADTGSIGGSVLEEILQSLVDDGTLTQDQAEAVIAELGDVLPGWPMARTSRIVGGLVIGVDALTDALGVTTEELYEAFADGESIADVAEEQGVDIETVIDAIVDAATQRIDEAVDNGRLTAEQAEEYTAKVTERITELVDEPGGPGLGGLIWRGGRIDGSIWPGLPTWPVVPGLPALPIVPGFPDWPGSPDGPGRGRGGDGPWSGGHHGSDTDEDSADQPPSTDDAPSTTDAASDA